MTEAEWLSCTDPTPMLEFLDASGRASKRKLRLFAGACCRHIWGLLTDRRSREAVEVAERSADGLAGEQELHAAWQAAREVSDTSQAEVWQRTAARAAEGTAAGLGALGAVWALGGGEAAARSPALARALAAGSQPAFQEGRAHSGALLRDILGNPFRPVTLSPAWQTPQVVALAQAAYDQRGLPAGTLDTTRLAVLADALEDAGCADADLLGHLRGPGPHVRGCFVIDALLGKS